MVPLTLSGQSSQINGKESGGSSSSEQRLPIADAALGTMRSTKAVILHRSTKSTFMTRGGSTRSQICNYPQELSSSVKGAFTQPRLITASLSHHPQTPSSEGLPEASASALTPSHYTVPSSPNVGEESEEQ